MSQLQREFGVVADQLARTRLKCLVVTSWRTGPLAVMVAGELLGSLLELMASGRIRWSARVIQVPVSEARPRIHSLLRDLERHMYVVIVTWRGEPIAGLFRPEAAQAFVVRGLPRPDQPRLQAALARDNPHPKARWPPTGPRVPT